MSDFQAIADRVEIEALRAEATDAVMMRDFDRAASLFTPDAVVRIPHIGAEVAGREQIRAGGELARIPALSFGGQRVLAAGPPGPPHSYTDFGVTRSSVAIRVGVMSCPNIAAAVRRTFSRRAGPQRSARHLVRTS